ncbi:MAG: hypothetical protein H6553_12610 [Chitinophagales bacterium]|nr:hypothetical protein [Chitinophagales bacterium]
MTTIKVDILNPKAKKLLKNLEDLDLIAIRDNSESGFTKLLEKLRSKELTKPTLAEITKEVELVRSKRYDKVSKKAHS